ncbi:MAG: hypothetical protein GY765_05860, partial [bacterium]|nr:hypothetical protein [bacterium]
MKKLFKQYPVPAIVLALVIVALGIFGLLHFGRITLKVGHLFNAAIALFDRSFKSRIANAGTFLLLAGALVLAVKMLIARIRSRNGESLRSSHEAVTESVREPVERMGSGLTDRLVAAILVALCLVFLKFAYFTFAFVFTAAVIIYFLLKYRSDPGVSFLLMLVILLVFLSPYIFKGQGVYMKISDVMDAWVPQQKILAESGSAFSLNPKTEIPNIVNGLRISGFVNSGYNIITILFMIFPPFVTFTLNVFIMAFTAFFGMRLLLFKHLLKSTAPKGPSGFQGSHHAGWEEPPLGPRRAAGGTRAWLINGVALCFAFLPFYPSGGLSIAGLPLLVYCFLNIKNNDWSKWNLFYIALFPFYSVLPFAGLFIIISLGVIFLIDIFKQRRFHTLYFVVLAVMSLLYLLSHFHMIYSILDTGFVSYREELKILPMSFADCFKSFLHNLMFDRSNIIQAQQIFV